ncbi:uncharacterized protein F5891DRAFT_975238 [Suillus fuscotomentosus]|uniref:Uncharacterized protein n=1 Tax=Suillus fuscotomentosus TaxID=1912939 RepID=A0AAD4DYD2_9AGAM|nr:uncharacterized protein F5891DRAFT_988589 [Suillus fuscotomentosus]XP_041221788.1 uncharacterized protein F5891DRAFT_983575 [Suillus fuscotomentosus]XP_041224286.1 uncharacterized protein F5891DRAFT_981618 [Suillus fuscotomentosus]XP_041232002.1 uncharacterized protein F5891DRAFT_975238 [Suillus fuscotomentosus]KAG1886912.1 hypothetical protein F5891DRAFT_988589 [Suillus fuscotomentosus]KAG1896212.1 hypothetical protein F5891DRAFT_983575 [Suillus fuscotomentosus]KAG1898710.1 hypothetical p
MCSFRPDVSSPLCLPFLPLCLHSLFDISCLAISSLGLLQLGRFGQQQAIQQILAGETKIKTVSLIELGISVFLPDTEISHLSRVTPSKKPTSRDRCLSSIVLYSLLTKFVVLVKLSSVHTTMLLWSSPEPWFEPDFLVWFSCGLVHGPGVSQNWTIIWFLVLALGEQFNFASGILKLQDLLVSIKCRGPLTSPSSHSHEITASTPKINAPTKTKATKTTEFEVLGE